MGQLKIGDIISIAGVYADGTQAPNEGPIDPAKPAQWWRIIEAVTRDRRAGWRLQPVDEDGTVQVFRDCGREYVILNEALDGYRHFVGWSVQG